MRAFIRLCSILFLLCMSLNTYAQTIFNFEIAGVQGDLLKNVDSRLQTLRTSYTSIPWDKESVAKFNQVAYKQIELAMQPFGYYHPKISSAIIKNAGVLTTKFTVQLGKPVYITKLDIKVLGPGKDNKKINDYLQALPIKQGDILNTQQVSEINKELYNLAQNQGYIKVSLKKNIIKVNLDKNTATVELFLDTGPRYHFGKITFSHVSLSRKLLLRYADFREGDYYSAEKLQDLQNAMASSEYFESVIIKPEMRKITGTQIPIKVNLVMNRRQVYTIGPGYGTDTGLRLTLGWRSRYLNQDGHHMSAVVKASKVQSYLNVSYFIPGKNPATDQYAISVGIEVDRPQDIVSRSNQLTLSKITLHRKWQRTFALTYQDERSIEKGAAEESSKLLMPSFTWLYATTNKSVDPTLGNHFKFDLRGASTSVISTVNFTQFEVNDKWFYSFNPVSRIILRGALGYTWVNDLAKLPVTEQFFTGGAGTIRGFKYKEIGPGKALMVGSIEYQHRIYQRWGAAVFYDTGTVTNSFNRKLISELSAGAGVGLVYYSQIGSIEVSIAKPVKNGDNDFRLQISVGPELS